METFNYHEHSCSCVACKQMCKSTPCLGTPEDILRISKAGFSDKLMETYWAVGLVNGTHNEVIPLISPKMIKHKGYAFLNENGLCELHDLGLKPYEGKMTNAHQKDIITSLEQLNQLPAYIVANEWNSKNYQNLKRRIFKNGN